MGGGYGVIAERAGARSRQIGRGCNMARMGSMILADRRMSLFVLAMALAPLQDAQAQARTLQGAWLEEGSSCASIFLATPNAVAFKRPASAFAPAFIVSGNRLSTPLATCRLVGVAPSGERQVLRLSCATSVSMDTARAIFSVAGDGNLYRYSAMEGGIATKYMRCTRDALKAP